MKQYSIGQNISRFRVVVNAKGDFEIRVERADIKTGEIRDIVLGTYKNRKTAQKKCAIMNSEQIQI